VKNAFEELFDKISGEVFGNSFNYYENNKKRNSGSGATFFCAFLHPIEYENCDTRFNTNL